jgi:hypothetical protein
MLLAAKEKVCIFLWSQKKCKEKEPALHPKSER